MRLTNGFLYMYLPMLTMIIAVEFFHVFKTEVILVLLANRKLMANY